MFDYILLESDENVQTLILERYSQIYPIPLLISDFSLNKSHFFYHLAYFLKPCKTILSYGMFKASYTQCGKSTLIDEIFSTEFTCNYTGEY